MQTLNLDLVQVWNLMNRMLQELYKAQSANVNYVHDWDRARIKQYLSAFRTLVDTISEKPDMDLPETNPMTFPLREQTAEIDIENEAMAQLCRLIRVGMIELIQSQSSRFSSGLFEPDRNRFLIVVEKAERHVSNYVEKVLPLDLPESSPRAPVQGAGLNTLGNV